MKRIILFFAFALLLAGCGPNPIQQAEANDQYVRTNQEMLDAEQAREFKTEMDKITVQDAARKQTIKDAALENMKASAALAAKIGGFTLAVTLCMMIISIGQAARVAVIGLGEATARAAMVRASLIQLDARTGQYPAFVQANGKVFLSMSDINTGKTLLLDMKNEADQMMIQAAAAIRYGGVVASHAAKSQQPDGVSIIEPLMLKASEVRNVQAE